MHWRSNRRASRPLSRRKSDGLVPSVRRQRPVYCRRRDALLTVVRQKVPDLVPATIAAGLHLVTWLPT
jgi:DNA-binding transcriptional MocR family regulator